MPDTFRAKVNIGNVSIELEGSEQFVRDELAFVKQNLLQKLDASGLGRFVPTTARKEGFAPGEKVPIKMFVEGKSANSDMEKAAAIAYYLAVHENTEEVDGDTISSWFAKAGWKPPKNPAATLADAKRRKGYFDTGSAGGYKLSDAGRYFVEHEWGAQGSE